MEVSPMDGGELGGGGGYLMISAATAMFLSKSPPEEGWRVDKCRVPPQSWREVSVRRFDLGGVTASRGLCVAAEILFKSDPYWFCVLTICPCINMSMDTYE